MISTTFRLIYYTIVSVLSFKQINIYNTLGNGIDVKRQSSCILLVGFLILLIGLRPIDYYGFGDSYNYYYSYRLLEGIPFTFTFNTPNIIWDNLFCFFCANRIDLSLLFLFGDTLYFGCTYLACRKVFPHDTVAAYLVFLGAFSTYTYSYNGVKAGIAASIFILGLAYRQNFLLSFALVFISWGFHHSMHMPIAAYILARIYRNPKTYFIIWVICLLMAVGHISFFQNLFLSMTDETGVKYLTQDTDNWGGKIGFRFDFVLYSAIPIWVAYIAIYKKRLKLSANYLLFLNIYLITNSIWILCMYVQYNNRIAYLSWSLYPIVLIYPFLNENWGPTRYKTFSEVMKYHLLFTLFMNVIYYE